MKKKTLKFSKISSSFGILAKTLIFAIIIVEIVLVATLPTLLKKQRFAPRELEQQKTFILLQEVQKQVSQKLKEDNKKITYPLMVAINNQLSQLTWELKKENFNFSISYFKDVQATLKSYQTNITKLDKLFKKNLQDINVDNLLKSVL